MLAPANTILCDFSTDFLAALIIKYSIVFLKREDIVTKENI